MYRASCHNDDCRDPGYRDILSHSSLSWSIYTAQYIQYNTSLISALYNSLMWQYNILVHMYRKLQETLCRGPASQYAVRRLNTVNLSIQYTAYLIYWTVHRLNTVWILLQYVHYIFKMLNRTPSESQYNQLIIFPTFSAYPFLFQYLFYAYIQCIHTTYPLLSILYNYLCASTLWEDAIKKMFSASKRKK